MNHKPLTILLFTINHKPLTILLLLLLASGCAMIDKARKEIPSPDPVVVVSNVVTDIIVPDPTPAPVTNTYVISKWHGPNGSNAKVVPFAIRSVTIKGGKLYLDHDPIPWGNSGDMTVICMAALDVNEWEGGKFDWIMPATGQKVKLTENIVDNYNKIAPHLKEGCKVLVWWMRVKDMKASVATETSPYFLTEWHK